jgi:hypothetical protein
MLGVGVIVLAFPALDRYGRDEDPRPAPAPAPPAA